MFNKINDLQIFYFRGSIGEVVVGGPDIVKPVPVKEDITLVSDSATKLMEESGLIKDGCLESVEEKLKGLNINEKFEEKETLKNMKRSAPPSAGDKLMALLDKRKSLVQKNCDPHNIVEKKIEITSASSVSSQSVLANIQRLSKKKKKVDMKPMKMGTFFFYRALLSYYMLF